MGIANLQIRASNQAGFTLLEIVIVVAIIGMLAAISIPNMVKARDSAQINSIYSNLRVIETAKDNWALENRKGTGEAIADMMVLSEYIRGGTIKTMVGEVYNPNPIGSPATATISVKLGTYIPGSNLEAPPF